MNMGLEGKTAVVTGGSKGIGFATARAFLNEGAKVAVCARNEDELFAACKELSVYGEVLTLKADATDQNEVGQFAETVFRHFGSIDCWVNNVGASFARKGDEYTLDELLRTEEVCFHSAVFGCQTAFRYMREKGGAIVNVASLAARCGTAGRSTLYGPLKSAVCQLAVMYAAEYAPYGVRVNSVLPGFTVTPAVQKNIPQAELDRNAKGTLLHRLATPDEIASPIVFLSSRAASYITAASIEVSGGRSVVLNPDDAYDKAGR